MRSTNWLAAAAAAALALGVAACGSSDDSSERRVERRLELVGAQAGRHHQRRRRDLPAPVYHEWAARFKDDRAPPSTTRRIGSGGGIAQFTAGTVDFGATDSAMKPTRRSRPPRRRATPVHVPTVLRRGHGRPTTSTASTRASSSTARRSPTSSSARSRSGTTRRSPSSNPGVEPARARTSRSCHRSDESGTTKMLHRRSSPTTRPEWKSGPGVDKTVKWPTGTGAKGNDGVAGCVKQTDGAVGYVEQAYALQNNFTTADVKNKSGQVRRADARRRPRRPARASRSRRTCASATINAPGPTAYPIAVADVPARLPGPVQGGHRARTRPSASRRWLDYALGDGQEVAPGAAVRAAARTRSRPRRRPRSTACSATAQPIERLELSDGSRQRSAARGGRSILERSPRRARCRTRSCSGALTGARGAASCVADRVLLRPPAHRGAAGVRPVRLLRLRLRQRLGRLEGASSARCRWSSGTLITSAIALRHRRAGRGRHRALRHRAVPAPAARSR